MAVALVACAVSLGAQTTGWKGDWITASDCHNNPNTWIALRKVADIDKVPQVLQAKIAADSKYWMWVNDSLVVFEGGLKRGPDPEGTYYE